MKTSEDKLNEALRNVLKRKFDDYEEQPNPNAFERIRARVKPARTGKYWWFTGALVLVSISGILLSRYANETATPVKMQTRSAAAETSAGHSSGGTGKAMSPKVPVRMSERPAVKNIAITPAARPVRVVESVFVNDFGGKPATGRHKTYSGNDPGATVSGYARQAAGTSPQTRRSDGPDAVFNKIPAGLAEPVPVDSAANVAPLEELASVPLKEASVPLHLRGVVVPAYKPAKVIVTNPARIAWLFNASALHSYQILTVPSSAAKDFQNFSFPSLFTANAVGIKLSGGVERNGIQVQLHYSGFRQTYSYEIANNNYLVQPDDKGQYHTVRQGDRMEENRRFSMLGIGVARQLRWGHSPVSRFYAAFGAEYSHDLNSGQSLGWVNLGLGKQFAVSRNAAFSIGPYAEFSPVKVKGTANPFYYQPYRVGISAGLRFTRP
ncbi:hypothetical protein [Dyadobacter sp. 676]|uniref:Outer membrane protein beta-barrel domain-containing protein n=1 Tax=Dyadobacter sp. 676 TaxID=3088362 RepID=A0AAU8FHH0_9BACT